MAAEQMALQFGQIQQKNNIELVKNLTAGLGKQLNTGFSSVVGSVKTMTKTAAGNLEDKLEARKAEKVKSARELKWQERQEKFFGFMKSKWSSVAENKKVQATGSFLKKMLLTLLGGFALFALPPDFWTGLKNMIFDFGKWIASISWEKDIKPMLLAIQDAVVAAKDFIQKIINKIFGTKDEKGNRQGGLLGKGGIASALFGDDGAATMSKFVAGIGVATTALALMFPGKAVKLVTKGIWGLAKGMGRGAGALGSKGLNMLAGGREGMAERYMTPEQSKMSAARGANAAKAGPRVGKTPKGGGWFKKLMGKFGKAGKFLIKIGKGVIQGLITMGPYGWAILAGIALGGLVWYFWDDITKVWDSVAATISEGFDKVKEMVVGAFGNVQGMVGGWLRGIGAGMIADWIDPKGADPSKPKKEFTVGNFAEELWTMYTSLWKEVLGVVQKGFKAVRGIAANFAEKMGMPPSLVNWIRGKEEKSTLTEKVGLTQEDMNVEDTRDHTKFGQWSSTPEGKEYMKNYQDEKSIATAKKQGKEYKGAVTKKAKLRAHAAWLKEQSGSTSDSGSTPDTQSDPNIDDDLSMSEGTHKKVGVSQADMGGVKWNKINSGGRQGVEDIITGIWNKHNIKAKPTFTSGFRKPKSALSLANTRSKHPHGTAFDLRSKDVPKDKQNAVFADLQSSLGIWGQHEKGDVNAGRRTGEHYHFQAAAQGFKGVVDQATIFLVGEDGAELVNVTPLSSPQNKTTAMNSLQTENAQGKMGGGNAPTVVSAPQSTTVNNQSSTALIMPPTAKSSVPL